MRLHAEAHRACHLRDGVVERLAHRFRRRGWVTVRDADASRHSSEARKHDFADRLADFHQGMGALQVGGVDRAEVPPSPSAPSRVMSRPSFVHVSTSLYSARSAPASVALRRIEELQY